MRQRPRRLQVWITHQPVPFQRENAGSRFREYTVRQFNRIEQTQGDAPLTGEWTLHNQIPGAKEQVRMQYDDHSDEYAATVLTEVSAKVTRGVEDGEISSKLIVRR